MTMMPNLEVEMMDTNALVPYAGNAKEHPEWQVDQICNSIEQFGFDDPIAIWTNDTGEPVIVEGHGRLLAAKQLDIDEVPCIKLDHLDDDARRAYTLVHNKLTTNTGYDEDILAAELGSLGDFNMEEFGFGPGETLEDYESVEEDDIPEPDFDEPSTVQQGQVWKLGEHRLMCGDSTDNDDVSKIFCGNLADMILTDPPYNCNYAATRNGILATLKSKTRHHDIKNDSMKDDEFYLFLKDVFTQCDYHMKDGASFYFWLGENNAITTATSVIKDNISSLYISQEITWVKNRIVLSRKDYQPMSERCLYGWKLGNQHYFAPTRCERNIVEDTDLTKMSKIELISYIHELLTGDNETDILRYSKPNVNDLHPTMKPVKLFAHLIRNSSKTGDIIYDAFGGSGTTLIAAEQMGRIAYLMELNPHYCDVIIKRWEELTGKTAELIEE